MPFSAEEKRELLASHPDSIIMKAIKEGGEKIVLIPKSNKGKSINFGGIEIELSMLHGATYWIGGNPDDLNRSADRAVTGSQLIPGDSFRIGIRRGNRKGERKKGPVGSRRGTGRGGLF